MKSKFNKILLASLLILLLSTFASAETPPSGGLTYFNFSSITDLWGSTTLTNNGANSQNVYPTFNLTGNSSPNSFNFDGSSDYIQSGSENMCEGSDECTVAGWFYLDTQPTENKHLMDKWGTDQLLLMRTIDTASDKVAVLWRDSTAGTSGGSGGTTSLVAGNWYHIVSTYKRNDVTNVYVNNVLDDTNPTDNFALASSVSTNLFIGKDSTTSANYFDGKMDVIKFYDIALSQTQVENLYNCNNITYCEPPVVEANITIENLSTNENTTIPQYGDNLSFFFDAVSNDANNISTCFLQNNETGVFVSVANTTVDANNFSGNITYTIVENKGLVYWRIECNNTLGGTAVSNVSTYTVKDFISPTIVLGPNNGYSDNNDTVISNALYNLSLNITFFDYNLFQTLVNITCNESGTIYTDEVLDHNTTTYNLFDTVDLSSYPLQQCHVSVQVSDDHTDNDIPDYEVTKTSKGAIYKTDASTIEIGTDGVLEEFKTKKIKDRYNFNFKYNEKSLTRTYTIKSEDTVYYQPTSKYSGHFVVWNEKLKTGNWIDFETDAEYKKYKVKQLGENHYEVEVKIDVPKEKELKPRKDGLFGLVGNDLTRQELELYYYGLEDVTYNSVGGTNVYVKNNTFEIGGAINITGVNVYDLTDLGNFTFNLTQLNGPVQKNISNVSNTNNYIIENVSRGNYSLFLNNTNFYDQTYAIELTSTDNMFQQDYETYQAIVNFRAKSLVTAEFLDKLNVTIDDGVLQTNQYSDDNTTVTFFVDADTYDYNITRIVYGAVNGSFNVSNLDNITIIENMSFISTVMLYDEKTLDPFNTDNPDSIEFLVFCPEGTFVTDVNSSTFNVTVPCDYEKFRVVLFYGTTSYFRTLIIQDASTIQNISIYLIDLNTTLALFNSFIIEDLLNQYRDPYILVKKVIGAEVVQITGDFVDVENKVPAYLIENNDYLLELYSSNQPVLSLGTYGASVAGEKNLRLYNIDISTNVTGFINSVSTSMGVDNDTGNQIAFANYQDIENRTDSVTWTLREGSANGTIIHSSTISDQNEIIFTYNITSIYNSTTIYGVLDIEHEEGNYKYTKLINEYSKIDLPVRQYIPENFLNWLFIFIAVIIALVANKQSANLAAIGILGFAGLMIVFDWITAIVGIVALGFLVIIIYTLKRGEKSE